MRNITIFVEEAINELERQIAETGKHVIKTESIKDLVNPRIIISGANDDSTYLAEIGFGQVIQSRLYEHGYRSLGKGYFVNLNSCRDVHYLMMLYDNADTSVADKVRIRKLIREQCDGQGVYIFDGVEPIGTRFNMTEEEFYDQVKADAV